MQFFDECDPLIAIPGIRLNDTKAHALFQREELELFFSNLDFRLEIQSRTKSQLNRHLASEFTVLFNLFTKVEHSYWPLKMPYFSKLF